MMRQMFKSKIHQARLTQTELTYAGSVTIPCDLLEEANMLPGERVQITVQETGARLETYVISGKRGSRDICLNGPAARLAKIGDTIVIISYCLLTDEEAAAFTPTVLVMNAENRVARRL